MSGAPFRDIIRKSKEQVGWHPASQVGRGRVQPEVAPPSSSKRSQAQFPDGMRSIVAGMINPRVEAGGADIELVRDARGRTTLRTDAPLHPGLRGEPAPKVTTRGRYLKAEIKRHAEDGIGTVVAGAIKGVDEQGWPVPEVPVQPRAQEGYVPPADSVEGIKDRVDGLVDVAVAKPEFRKDILGEIEALAAQHPDEVKAVVESWAEGETE